jgi:hypothetical protein
MNLLWLLIIILVVVSLVRARRGDPDAWGPLDEALSISKPTGELQMMLPVAAGVTDCCGTVSDGLLPVVPFCAPADTAPVRTLTVRMIPSSVPVPPCAAVTISEVAIS